MSLCSKLTSKKAVFTGDRYLLSLSHHLRAASKGEQKVGKERKGAAQTTPSEINIQHAHKVEGI